MEVNCPKEGCYALLNRIHLCHLKCTAKAIRIFEHKMPVYIWNLYENDDVLGVTSRSFYYFGRAFCTKHLQ